MLHNEAGIDVGGNLDDSQTVALPPGLFAEKLQAPPLHSAPHTLSQPVTIQNKTPSDLEVNYNFGYNSAATSAATLAGPSPGTIIDFESGHRIE